MAIEIPLANGKGFALVDDEDYELVSQFRWHRWQGARVAYAHRGLWIPGRPYSQQKMHMLITGWPETDHINHDGLDNRRVNLRPATRSQNNAHQRRRKDNVSGYKGVYWHKRDQRWCACVNKDGRLRWSKLFADPEEAARARDLKALELHGEFVYLNFPDDRPSICA